MQFYTMLCLYIFARRLLSSRGLYWLLVHNGDALPFVYQLFAILVLPTTALCALRKILILGSKVEITMP